MTSIKTNGRVVRLWWKYHEGGITPRHATELASRMARVSCEVVCENCLSMDTMVWQSMESGRRRKKVIKSNTHRKQTTYAEHSRIVILISTVSVRDNGL